jgi:flagellar motor switch/type III secretory pathway protein FliN
VAAPFPWKSLPRVSRDHVGAVSRVRRAFPGARAATLARELSTLIGHPVEITIKRITTGAPTLGARGDVITFDGLAIEIEPELSLAVASALAGGKMPKIARGRNVDPEVLGAVIGVAQWLGRACGIDIALSHEGPILECVLVDAQVRLGMLRTSVRLAVGIPVLDRTPRGDAVETLQRLNDTPLSLACVIGVGTARAIELSDLRADDVVVVDERTCGLVAPTSSRGARCTRIEPDSSGRIRVKLEEGALGLAAPRPPNEDGAPMTDDTGATMQLPALDEGGRLADDLAELPLVVRVELGEATLAAREWAAIATGDVVVLDRRVGDPVSLRIGGKVLARGELVEVDGALGVRITERTS